MKTDETTPETNVTIGMLEELLSTANRCALRAKARGDAYKDRYSAAALATGIVLGEVRRLIPPRIPTPTPVPAPKFKERDWVQHKNSGAIWRIVGLSATSVPLMYRVESADGLVGDMYEEFLLPIPPKPDKVQAGYRLTGRVLGPDERTKESYWVGKEPDEHGVHAVTQSTGKGIVGCGERRWEAELVPALKFKEGDWVQNIATRRNGKIIAYADSDWPGVTWDGGKGMCHPHANDLLPIPPKPDKVQAGYRLRGDVKVADGSEPYVSAYWGPEHPVLRARTGCAADVERFGGRRWIVELDPVCPHCQDTHVCPHCKENAT